MTQMEYVSRNAAITASDTLTAVGDVVATASGAIQVPAGAIRIAQIIVAVTADSAATGAASFLMRLAGNGLVPSQHDITIGAVGGTLATGAAVQATALVLATNLKVVPNNQIAVSVAMNEVDLGTAPVCVTLGFEEN